MRPLRKGKVKDIYELTDGNLLFHFSDRVSAFDIQMATPIPRKGEILCKFGEFWFNNLPVKNHMLEVPEKDKMVVRKLRMIPIECVVRGYFYGSLVDRQKSGLGSTPSPEFEQVLAGKLPAPIFDPTTKSEDHDRPISRAEAVSSHVVNEHEYDFLEKTALSLYLKMSEVVDRAGFIIADVKFEFGKNKEGEIILGDSLGPDEYRLWLKKDYQPGKTQESYDKQLLRDWLVKTGFKATVDRLATERKKPPSPEIAPEIASELSRRYIFAFERISGQKL